MQNTRQKHIWLASAGIAFALWGQTAYAQQAEGNGELVVTARRVNEKLTDVPGSVSVISEAQLAKTGIRSTEDFVKVTPGVTIVASTTDASDVQINIRGVNGARDAEGSIALVVDGILKTNPASLNQSQGTITQVEILKGPQGAIYGRNATAGAFVMQTRKPTATFKAPRACPMPRKTPKRRMSGCLAR